MPPSAETVSGLLGTLYEAAASADRWPEFLGSLRQATSADTAYFILMDPESRCDFSLNQGFDPALERAYAESFYKDDITYNRFVAAKQNHGEWIGTRQSLITDREFRRSLIYNEFCVPQKIEHICAGALSGLDGGLEGGIGLQRTRQGEPFGNDTIELLSLLAPHLKSALNTHRLMNRLRGENVQLRETVEHLGAALVSLDRKGRVVRLTAAATAILESRDGIELLNGLLRASVPAEQARLTEITAGAAATGQGRGVDFGLRRNTATSPEAGNRDLWTPPSGGAMLISRRSPKRPLQVVVFPFNSSDVLTEDKPAALLLMSDPDGKPASRASVLRVLYRLTPTECRLADLLAEGHEIIVAAARLKMSATTARFHLKSMFRKTGTRRQSELIRLILGLPGVQIIEK
jgi:DNA-binding CsgD family transcriptional regulator/PAS domain-containing protein